MERVDEEDKVKEIEVVEPQPRKSNFHTHG